MHGRLNLHFYWSRERFPSRPWRNQSLRIDSEAEKTSVSCCRSPIAARRILLMPERRAEIMLSYISRTSPIIRMTAQPYCKAPLARRGLDTMTAPRSSWKALHSAIAPPSGGCIIGSSTEDIFFMTVETSTEPWFRISCGVIVRLYVLSRLQITLASNEDSHGQTECGIATS